MIIEIRAPIETTLIRTNNHLYTTQNKQKKKKSLVNDPCYDRTKYFSQPYYYCILEIPKKVDFFKKKK